VPVTEIETPEVVTGQWRVVQPERRLAEGTGTAERTALPWRLALPESPKREATISAEDQARLKVIVDFAQSLPLVSPDNNVDWLVSLAETEPGAGVSAPAYEQLLKGELRVHYEPAWKRHPVYQDLTTLLQGQTILQDLNAFVDGVDHCATEATGLLQDIYLGAKAGIPTDFFQKGGGEFISSVYSDAIGWFLGKSLREPSLRDYAIKPDDANAGMMALWLAGEGDAYSSRPLVQALEEKDASRLQALHLELRRKYRNSSQAKRVADMITQSEVRRTRLLNVLNQFGQIKQ
jgi:hypothetical protein